MSRRWLAANRVVHDAGDQWLRRPAPSDLKVIVVDIDRASIDALGTWPWPRETMARLVEAGAIGPPGPPVLWLCFRFPLPHLRGNSRFEIQNACDHYLA